MGIGWHGLRRRDKMMPVEVFEKSACTKHTTTRLDQI